MLQITPHMRILVATEPADFRNGIDGLAGLCRRWLKEDPFSGTIFCFRNRSQTSVKILVYDGQGFWLCQKRLSKGKVRWWPGSGDVDRRTIKLAARHLQVLIWNGDPDGSRMPEDWRRIREPED